MQTRRSTSKRRWGPRLAALLGGVVLALLPIGPPAEATPQLRPPLPPPLRVLDGFQAPSQRWGPGNRGVDLAATTGEPVYAGAAGTVVYAATLAGREVISIAVGGEHLTYEPVHAIVALGAAVTAGQLIGYLAAEVDDCGPPGSCLHWGVRLAGSYVDPLGLLGGPSVRLLPIWGQVAPGSLTRSALPSPGVPLPGVPPAGVTPAAATSARALVAAVSLAATSAADQARPNSERLHVVVVAASVAITSGTALTMAGGAAFRRSKELRARVRRSVQPASREAGARPWYASGRSGSRSRRAPGRSRRA
jgi:murein DD-endopeptidase MepM/ murein hydrolase activator NlpD